MTTLREMRSIVAPRSVDLAVEMSRKERQYIGTQRVAR
jgi:hypothetical protein